jgi:hypothetical protein
MIMRLRRATGLGVLAARKYLLEHDADQCERIIRAAEWATPRDPGSHLRDPLESDPIAGPIIARILNEVGDAVEVWHRARIAELERESPAVADLFRSGRGLCHRIWLDAKERLLREEGIDWKSPAEMNPGSCFD